MIFEPNSMKMPTGSARVPPSSSATRSINPNGPVMVEHKNMKFLITDRPTNATLPQFVEVSSDILLKDLLIWDVCGFILNMRSCKLIF